MKRLVFVGRSGPAFGGDRAAEYRERPPGEATFVAHGLTIGGKTPVPLERIEGVGRRTKDAAQLGVTRVQAEDVTAGRVPHFRSSPGGGLPARAWWPFVDRDPHESKIRGVLRRGTCAIRAAAIAGTIGCGGPVPVAIVRTDDFDRATDDPSDETRELVDEAFGVWGLAWTPDRSAAALELTITDLGGADVRGFTRVADRCTRSIVAVPHALTLAHEVGHAFGLGPHATDDLDEYGHDSVPGRVMAQAIGWDVPDDQAEIVADEAREFSGCMR